MQSVVRACLNTYTDTPPNWTRVNVRRLISDWVAREQRLQAPVSQNRI